MNRIVVDLPLKIVSVANLREHWAVRAKRARRQRLATYLALPPLPKAERVCVELTRLGPRLLDSDNLVSALKSVRDGVSDRVGWDDADERYEWHYAQIRQPEHVLRVVLTLT